MEKDATARNIVREIFYGAGYTLISFRPLRFLLGSYHCHEIQGELFALEDSLTECLRMKRLEPLDEHPTFYTSRIKTQEEWEDKVNDGDEFKYSTTWEIVIHF